MKKFFDDLFLVDKRNDDPQWTYIVYCTEESAGQRPAYVGMIAGHYSTYPEARASATGLIIDAYQPPWGNPEKLSEKLAAALGIPKDTAAGRLKVANAARSSENPYIICPVCCMTSAHPEDIRHGFCNNCRDYTSSEEFARRLDINNDTSEGNT